MLRFLLMISLCLFTTLLIQGQAKDSIPQSSLFVNPRLNSAGYFPFTGALLNHNTNFDVNIVYQNKWFGYLLFKSVDLEEKESPINYLQTALFKNISINKKVSFRAFFGYLFAQTHSFREEGDSDYFAAATLYWDITSRLRLENIALYTDVSTQPKLVNRLLLLYTLKDFRFDFSIHERMAFETDHYSTSAVLAVNFPELKLTKHLSAQTTISYQNYLTKARPDFALNNGFLFSLSFPMKYNW